MYQNIDCIWSLYYGVWCPKNEKDIVYAFQIPMSKTYFTLDLKQKRVIYSFVIDYQKYEMKILELVFCSNIRRYQVKWKINTKKLLLFWKNNRNQIFPYSKIKTYIFVKNFQQRSPRESSGI